MNRKSKEAEFSRLFTRWADAISPDKVLAEYPRPKLVRKSFYNLNGLWNYAFTEENEIPKQFEGLILVPFSPESELSGVGRQLLPNEFLWYQNEFKMEKNGGKRLLLHFGAVDQGCKVYVNRKFVGKHVGGYLPFTFDITDYLEDGQNELLVMVKDYSDTSYHARGKQRLLRGGMFYTAQSGIWQTVWMEWVCQNYVEELKITPQYDDERVEIFLCTEKRVKGEIRIYAEKDLITGSYFHSNEKFVLSIPEMRSWSPEDPFLYTVEIEIGEDVLSSYFAMRKCSVGKDKNGISRLMLNNQPYFHNGILDQGYWPEGLYTAPCDEAIIYDIKKMKELGFNMLRKHSKIEPERWYYHCDRLGMLVWQDMVNGGSSYKMFFTCYLPNMLPKVLKKMRDNRYHLFGREDEKGRIEYKRELKEMIKHLYHYPSIVMWVPFNEGWGQFDAEQITELIRRQDEYRTVDQASGWFDQNGGDVKSVHNYFHRFHMPVCEERPVVLSEFGGYACQIKGHSFCEKIYGYRAFRTQEKLTSGYERLIRKEIIPSLAKGLSAAVYTQLTDVEEEVNGFLTYDREILKIDEDRIKKCNEELYGVFEKCTRKETIEFP